MTIKSIIRRTPTVKSVLFLSFVLLCVSFLFIVPLEYKQATITLAGIQQKFFKFEATPGTSYLEHLKNSFRKKRVVLSTLPVVESGKYKTGNLSRLTAELDEDLKLASLEKINILLWYLPWGVREHGQFQIINASECGLCHVTHDRLLVEDPATKAVVFHFFEFRPEELPVKRRPDQYYVYWIMESPTYTIDNHVVVGDFNSMFNLTMSHRPDSDIISPYGFPIHTILRVQRESNVNIDSLIKKKTKLALWVVSNCRKSRGAWMRMNLVKSMIAAGLEIDLFGKCFRRQGSWKNEDYKFYLAFENSYHCKGYITEKLYRNSLIPGAVPVVFGALKVDYLVAAPPNSFIYAEDYTVKELVDYLNYLDKNDTAYRKYLEWREMDVTKLQDYRRAWSYCHLCRVLHGINYDNIFNKNFHKGFDEHPLFGSLPRKAVKSVSEWFFGKEDKDCLIHTSRPK